MAGRWHLLFGHAASRIDALLLEGPARACTVNAEPERDFGSNSIRLWMQFAGDQPLASLHFPNFNLNPNGDWLLSAGAAAKRLGI